MVATGKGLRRKHRSNLKNYGQLFESTRCIETARCEFEAGQPVVPQRQRVSNRGIGKEKENAAGLPPRLRAALLRPDGWGEEDPQPNGVVSA